GCAVLSTGARGGCSARQTSRTSGQRGLNRHPGGGRDRLGTEPAIESSGPSDLYFDGAALSSAFVYGCRGERKTSATGPYSTIRPAYMTPISSAVSAMTPRSWLMNRIAA